MSWLDSKLSTPALAGFTSEATAPAAARLEPAIVAAPWRVDRLTTTESMAAIAEEWNDLLRTTRCDGLFLTWEWLSTWWKHCAGGGRLAIHTVRFGRDLLGIAPLRSARSRSCPPIHAQALQFLGTGNAGSDYLDLVIRPARRAQTVGALASAIGSQARVLDLAQLRAGESSTATLAEQLERRRWRSLRRTTARCPWIPLAGHTFDSYLASLGASHRANFRRRLRQLQREHAFEWRPVRTETERREAIEILFRLHLDRFSDRGGSDGLHTAELRDFHREMSRIALDRGWLRLFVLWLDHRPAAALYGFRYGGSFLFYQAGFDRAFARSSVGLVAMGLAIEAAIAEGATEFDLLHGDERYKSLWARSWRELERIELFPPTPAGRAHLLLRRGARAARRVGAARRRTA
jgi:CelD/BcsL family acetyltransferase involved in cellulose biosynthesis